MVRATVKCLIWCYFVAGCLAVWKPADGVMDLDAVEQALHNVENAPLSSEQRKMASKVVGNVDHVVMQLKSNSSLTKAQKMQTAKAAIDELQDLQSQWELSAVETALGKITSLPHLSSGQRAAAKKVVADVEATVERVESGKLLGAARNEQVRMSIKELQDLQQDWMHTTTAARVEELQKEITSKKALLKKEEMELKLAGLQKELAEKQLMLKKLTAQKGQADRMKKQSTEDAAEATMIARLVATAKALAAKPKVAADKETAHLKIAGPAAGTLTAIAADLEARERNVSASISRMDVEEKALEAKLSRSTKAATTTQGSGRADATDKEQKMMAYMLKQEHRKYLKARAIKETQRQELADGVHSVRSGDVAGLSKLMQKMQQESERLEAKTKSFLY